MMYDEETPKRRAIRWLQPLLWMACGFLLFLMLFIDPFRIHSVDTWLQSRLGPQPGPPSAESVDAAEAELWTCGMHPHVLFEEPGRCPICDMQLVPVKAASGAPGAGEFGAPGGEREILFYRNPMDPTITSPALRKMRWAWTMCRCMPTRPGA